MLFMIGKKGKEKERRRREKRRGKERKGRRKERKEGKKKKDRKKQYRRLKMCSRIPQW